MLFPHIGDRHLLQGMDANPSSVKTRLFNIMTKFSTCFDKKKICLRRWKPTQFSKSTKNFLVNLKIQHVFSFFVQRELNGHFFSHFNCQIIYDIYVLIFEIQYQRSFQISGCLRPVGGVCCTGELTTSSLSINPSKLPKYKIVPRVYLNMK